MNICECLTTTAKLFPDRIAVVFGDRQWTFRELEQKSQAAASVFQQHDVKPGDRIALMLPNAPSFPVWYYGALRMGAIAVSVSTRLAAGEVAFVIEDSGAKVFIASQDAMSAVEAELPANVGLRLAVDEFGEPTEDTSDDFGSAIYRDVYNASPNEAALILYTSGTTGFPKGATLSHGNVRSNVHAFNHLCNMQPDDNVLVAVPLFHCFGQNALLNSVLNVGGTIVLQQRFDLSETKRLIADQNITQLYGVPMMFSLLLDSCIAEELAGVNYCFSAAATLPIQTGNAWLQKFNLPIHEGYGLTETSPFATYNHRLKFVPGSIGMPIDSVEVKIVDPETGEPCATGQPGEIAIRGPNVMLGYWNRPKETADAIREGWFYSGDIGQLDESGYLYIVDRVKDMITVGGLKVFPAEVERVLLDHDAVAEVAIVGAPDSVFGEQVFGFLVLTDGSHEQTALSDISAYAQSHLGNYKVPRRMMAIEKLPRNPSGKVLKTKLREMAAESINAAVNNGQTDTAAPLTAQSPTLKPLLQKAHRSERLRTTIEFLRQQVRNLLGEKSLPGADQSFVDAGLDSLAMVSLSTQLQIEVGNEPELPPTLLFDYPRISDLAGFLVERLNENSPAPHATDTTHPASSTLPSPHLRSVLRVDIEEMSEEQALVELMKELE